MKTNEQLSHINLGTFRNVFNLLNNQLVFPALFKLHYMIA